jgi:hypothetical protein
MIQIKSDSLDVGKRRVLPERGLRFHEVAHPREGDGGLGHAVADRRDVCHGLQPPRLALGVEIGMICRGLDVHAGDDFEPAALRLRLELSWAIVYGQRLELEACDLRLVRDVVQPAVRAERPKMHVGVNDLPHGRRRRRRRRRAAERAVALPWRTGTAACDHAGCGAAPETSGRGCEAAHRWPQPRGS